MRAGSLSVSLYPSRSYRHLHVGPSHSRAVTLISLQPRSLWGGTTEVRVILVRGESGHVQPCPVHLVSSVPHSVNRGGVFTGSVIHGAQDTLPQDMAPWHPECFSLEEFEKQHVQDGLADLPLKQVV